MAPQEEKQTPFANSKFNKHEDGSDKAGKQVEKLVKTSTEVLISSNNSQNLFTSLTRYQPDVRQDASDIQLKCQCSIDH